MGACEPTPSDRPGLLATDPAPVLASVKVVRPAGRSTLTPAAAGGYSSHEKPAPDHPGRLGPPALLTGPDPMGAVRCSACDRLGPGYVPRLCPGSRDPCRPGRSWTDRGGRPAASSPRHVPAGPRVAVGTCAAWKVEWSAARPPRGRRRQRQVVGMMAGLAARGAPERSTPNAARPQHKARVTTITRRYSTWKRATRSLAPC
jgi:hypothetical protein